MSSINQNQKIKFSPAPGVLHGLNPAVVKAHLMRCSQVQLLAQVSVICEILDDEGLSANERACLLNLYVFCKNLYLSKYLARQP